MEAVTHMPVETVLSDPQAPYTPTPVEACEYQEPLEQTPYLAADSATFEPSSVLECGEAEVVAEMAVDSYLDTLSAPDG